jgi:hypothetical protein
MTEIHLLNFDLSRALMVVTPSGRWYRFLDDGRASVLVLLLDVRLSARLRSGEWPYEFVDPSLRNWATRDRVGQEYEFYGWRVRYGPCSLSFEPRR